MGELNCLRCQYRHDDNGNCTAAGGFCTAVPAAHCRLLREYLDTDMTPDEIERVVDAYGRGQTLRTENALRLEAVRGIPTHHLLAMAKATNDGHLMIFPAEREPSGCDQTTEEREERTLQRAVAIDFDGCLCANAYPEIGAPNWNIIVAAADKKKHGAGLILWTCREGKLLEDALEACERWGLEFDAVNDSLPSWKEFYGDDSRKVGADEYWDDKALRVENGEFVRRI